MIPTLLEELRRELTWLDDDWNGSDRPHEARSVVGLRRAGIAAGRTAGTITLEDFARTIQRPSGNARAAFPNLVRGGERTDQVLDRALHHLGELARVRTAAELLRDAKGDNAVRALGQLIDSSHESLRDLYEVSTPEVEALLEIVRRGPAGGNARLMGGSFGGNVLALVKKRKAAALIERIKPGTTPRGNRQAREKAP